MDKYFLLICEDENGVMQYDVCPGHFIDELDPLSYVAKYEISERAYRAFQDLLSR